MRLHMMRVFVGSCLWEDGKFSLGCSDFLIFLGVDFRKNCFFLDVPNVAIDN